MRTPRLVFDFWADSLMGHEHDCACAGCRRLRLELRGVPDHAIGALVPLGGPR